jgi:hypothetical protein
MERAGRRSGAGLRADFGPARALIVHDDGSGAKLFAGGDRLSAMFGGAMAPIWTWNGVAWGSSSSGYSDQGIALTFAERSTGAVFDELFARVAAPPARRMH